MFLFYLKNWYNNELDRFLPVNFIKTKISNFFEIILNICNNKYSIVRQARIVQKKKTVGSQIFKLFKIVFGIKVNGGLGQD